MLPVIDVLPAIPPDIPNKLADLIDHTLSSIPAQALLRIPSEGMPSDLFAYSELRERQIEAGMSPYLGIHIAGA
ncbi:hypothetical protein Nepgr_018105 [Nepenthes gracilis]|uniref:Uncharacterized protein n=1 Tax=Nepenthes gracilis TaxID=150966 RepID=A0AAD3SSY2_NEPGR|nr:hypothetical protein Nepgr_018105 [Nepenthes gracilis]